MALISLFFDHFFDLNFLGSFWTTTTLKIGPILPNVTPIKGCDAGAFFDHHQVTGIFRRENPVTWTAIFSYKIPRNGFRVIVHLTMTIIAKWFIHKVTD